MFQNFAALNLRQAFLDLAEEPFVVINQTLDRVMYERFTLASLLRGNAIKLGLKPRRKIYFHVASVGVLPDSVKRICVKATERSFPPAAGWRLRSG